MDGRESNGGARKGAGRKPKADEIALIELLSPLDDLAFKALEIGVKAGEFPYVKMFMEYRYGKPKETVNLRGELDVLWNEVRKYGADEETNESTGLSGGQDND